MVNEVRTWKGAVEPAEVGASGNEVQLWKGAVEPVYVAPVVASSSPTGHVSSKRRPVIRYVDQPEEEEIVEVKEKPMLRMTPEVRNILKKYKKGKEAKVDGGLIGSKKGIL